MNQASQYLLSLAKRNIQAYIANPEAKAAMVTGSTATGQNLFGVLAGLNRLYYSTFQFKRMRQFIEKMNIVPENLYMRLESLDHQEPLSAASQLKELVAETVELVELHMPALDTSKVKESLARQESSWKTVRE